MLRVPGRHGLTALAAAALLLGSVASTHAALTTPGCLAKKLEEWGKLRKCQATEKALQGKPGDPARCQTKFDEKLATISAKATAAAIACRFGVNGDGTATDYDTGLVWEQKTDDGSVHDKDDLYTWNTTFPGATPNGTAFTDFLGTLNNGTSGDGISTGGCFAGHCDWRLPSIGELASIVDLAASGCSSSTGPCIDQTIFGPSVPNTHWSAATYSDSPFYAWVVDFYDGSMPIASKTHVHYVRAVRSGL